MRNMSFSLTTEQIRNRTKTVTRRLGWKNLKPGEHFMAVEKCQGLKKGEKVVKICELVCVSNLPEDLSTIISNSFRGDKSEMELEGFPELSPSGFVIMFSNEMKVSIFDTIVNRIEFAYVGELCQQY